MCFESSSSQLPVVLSVVLCFIVGSVASENTLSEKTATESKNNILHIHYYLYTRNNPMEPSELFVDDMNSVVNSDAFFCAPLIMMTHGFAWTGDISHEFIFRLKDAYLNVTQEDVNIILVDWSKLAEGPFYPEAASNVPVVGEQNAKFLEFLVNHNVTTLKQVHLIGHSLGAHVFGVMGGYIDQAMGMKVARISGLDPAKPMFKNATDDQKLDSSDGDFVDVIHTDGTVFGLFQPLGHADFYPNGGLYQPGCISLVKFYKREITIYNKAHQYYVESLINPEGFKACKCTRKAVGSTLFHKNFCSCDGFDSVAYMGQDVSDRARGIFYLKTNDGKPFAMG